MNTLAALAGLLAFVAAGIGYAAIRWLGAHSDRLCACYHCSARRESYVRGFRGPGRLHAALGHLINRLSRKGFRS